MTDSATGTGVLADDRPHWSSDDDAPPVRPSAPRREASSPADPPASAPLRSRLDWIGMVAVTAVAFAVNSWNLDSDRLGNAFYAAGARSMAHNWHNFFFNSFDPGGFITVDKPPVAQWIDAASVHMFGFNPWALLLPSAIAGALSVALLWCIVRRWFGVGAATAAGLVLALTPITVSVSRINLPEPFMILSLLVAAWAVLRSLEARHSMLWLLGAGAAVGVAFNTKMLAGYIPLPAVGLVVVLCTPGKVWRKIGHAAVFAASSIVLSLPWLLIVDATSKSHRPYVGGSTNDMVWNLVFGYNGFARVDGNGQGGPGGRRGGFGGGGAGGPGGIIAGTPGWLRMFGSALGGQIAWLIPMAVAGLLVGGWLYRRDRTGRAVIALFAGWLLMFGVVFSTAQGTFHAYYTSAMAPGIAALVGIGGAALYRLLRTHPGWWGAGLAAFGATFLLQRVLIGRFPQFYGWATEAMLAVLIAAVSVVAFAYTVGPRWRAKLLAGGLVVGLAGTLIAPAAWSISQTDTPAVNTTLPQAGPRTNGAASFSFGSGGTGGTGPLATWLKDNHTTEKWDLVVSSAMDASSLIAYHGTSVMALGGFLGTDPATNVTAFSKLVDRGEVRWVQLSVGGFGGGGRGGTGGFGGGGFGGFRGGPQATPAGSPGFTPAGGGAGGFPGFGTRGGGRGGFGSGNTANQVISAVIRTCPSVVSTPANKLPSAYSGQIFDCRGKGAALAKLAP